MSTYLVDLLISKYILKIYVHTYNEIHLMIQINYYHNALLQAEIITIVQQEIPRKNQGDCREETRRAYKILISASNWPFGQPSG